MFTSVLSTVTKALFQQFEVKIPPPTVFDPYQTEQSFQERLNREAHPGTNFDLCWTQDDEEDAIFVDKMEAEGQVACLVNAYRIGQPGINRMHFMASIAAKGMMKKVSHGARLASTGARLAYSSAHSGKKVLKKKAMNFVSAPAAIEEESIMEGYYDADGNPVIERLDDSSFGAGSSNRENHLAEDMDPEDKCMDIPMQNLSAIETVDDTWELV